MKTLRFVLFSAVLLAVFFMLVAVTASAAPPNRPFVGAWEATDVDGSHERASIGGGGNGQYHVHAFDDAATACGLDASGKILYAAIATGTAIADAANVNVLHAVLPVWCLSHPRALLAGHDPNTVITYTPGADTLYFWGVTWTRSGK